MSASEEPRKRKLVIERFGVVLHNDDVNTMEHVVQALIDTFLCSPEQALRTMFYAHRHGSAICAVELLEPAEFHYHRLCRHGLNASLELVESREG